MKLPEAHSADLIFPVPIKTEVELLALHPFAPDLADQELEVNMETLHTITTGEGLSGIHAEQLAVEQQESDSFLYKESEVGVLSHAIQPKDSRAHCKGIFKCGMCPRSFKKFVDIKQHLLTHDKNSRQFRCQSCDIPFDSQFDLQIHMRLHTGDTYNCEICGSSFTQKGNLEVHMLRQHLGKTQPCNADPRAENDDSITVKAEFITDEEFIEERSSDTAPFVLEIEPKAPVIANNEPARGSSSEENTVTCEVRHNIYANEVVKTHSCLEQSPLLMYKCKLCSRLFSKAEYLRLHIVVIHDKDRIRKFTCQSCLRAFDSKANLMSHISQTHTGDTHKDASSAQSSKDCEVAAADDQSARINIEARNDKSIELCDRSYPKELINSHMRLGHSELPYKCEFCPRYFAEARNLSEHVVTHDRGCEFTCQSCGKAFCSRVSLGRHMRSKHSEPKHQNSFAPLTSADGSAHPGDNLQHTSGPQASHKDTDRQHPHSKPQFKRKKLKLTCQLCFKSFCSKESWVQHIVIAHPPDPPVDTKIDLSSHEEFIDEDKPSGSGQGSQKRDLPVENEERAPVRVDGPQTPNYVSVHSEDKQQYTSTPLTSGVASVHSDEKQQNIPGLQASSDASVHPKTELMSDEEFLDEDSCTDSAEEGQQSDAAHEAEFACQAYRKTY